jgi:hypothetical protein
MERVFLATILGHQCTMKSVALFFQPLIFSIQVLAIAKVRLKHLFAASLSESNVNIYVIIIKVIDAILSTKWEPES